MSLLARIVTRLPEPAQSLARRLRESVPGLLVAERFVADTAGLGGIRLDLHPIPLSAGQPVTVSVVQPSTGDARQLTVGDWALFRAHFHVPFPPFTNEAGESFHLFVTQGKTPPSLTALAEHARRTGLDGRPPITLPEAGGHGMIRVLPGSNAALPVAYGIDVFWCDRHGMYFEGWVHCHQHRVTGLRIRVGEDAYEVPSFRRRDDLLAFHPEHPHVAEGGFVGYVQCRPGQPVSLEVTSEGGSRSVPVDLPKGSLLKEPWTEFQHDTVNDFVHTLKRFVTEVNERRLTVAEIGSRHVGEASENMRSYFQGAGRYIGIDIHAAPGVDVVGDAHALDRLVGRGGIDAVFSLSVIEHLAYPWVLAAATNRALAMGGLVFHSAPQTYPLHEQPNDFWRYSDEALKVLFGPQTGFEVIAAGMVNAMHMHPEERRGVFATIPLNPGYGNAFILARKVRDLPDGAVAWPIDDNQSHDRAKLYPQRPSS
ncbi:hypothetical protein [Azospirillum formosense]|uniref:class I SAM-dependent methyltransferase n=1 Tax=Azospirillum formosense TaxID=861533 RepID=UPI00338F2315